MFRLTVSIHFVLLLSISRLTCYTAIDDVTIRVVYSCRACEDFSPQHNLLQVQFSVLSCVSWCSMCKPLFLSYMYHCFLLITLQAITIQQQKAHSLCGFHDTCQNWPVTLHSSCIIIFMDVLGDLACFLFDLSSVCLWLRLLHKWGYFLWQRP